MALDRQNFLEELVVCARDCLENNRIVAAALLVSVGLESVGDKRIVNFRDIVLERYVPSEDTVRSLLERLEGYIGGEKVIVVDAGLVGIILLGVLVLGVGFMGVLPPLLEGVAVFLGVLVLGGALLVRYFRRGVRVR